MRLLLVASVVVIAANAIALTRVASNRSGEPVNLIEMTEREVPIRHRDPESGTVFLRIQFDHEQSWFGPEKLASLGFDVSVPASDPNAATYYRRMRQRRAFLVLEYDPNREIKPEEHEWRTRLFSVDAGLDPQALRERYPDKRYVIVPGVVGIHLYVQPDKQPAIRGNVSRLLVEAINVPRQFLPSFKPLEARHTHPPRYSVTLRYGKLYEPEVINARVY